MLEETDIQLIKELITDATEAASLFSTKKVGDTPTDALQLVPKKYLDTKYYQGFITAFGVVGFLPPGWTVTQTGTGLYEVFHHLGTDQYAVVVTPIYRAALDPGARGAFINTIHTATSFIVNTCTVSDGADKDTDFFFFLAVN